MTALIVSRNSYFGSRCAAALVGYGVVAVRTESDRPLHTGADLSILDIQRWDAALPSTLGGRMLAVVTTDWRMELELPRGALFFLKPVDIDVMVERIMATWKWRYSAHPAPWC